MTEYIAHRINTIEELMLTPKEYGVEIDIRSYGGELILQHEPFIQGEYLSEWLKYYQHGTLILNIKEEGLEERILQCLKDFNISNFFFLDQSFPFFIKLLNKGEKRTSIRFSEFESLQTLIALELKPNWVWVDCFSKYPLTKESYEILKSLDLKICLVSPELHGRKDFEEIVKFHSFMRNEDIVLDAICTKIPEYWKELSQW